VTEFRSYVIFIFRV